MNFNARATFCNQVIWALGWSMVAMALGMVELSVDLGVCIAVLVPKKPPAKRKNVDASGKGSEP
jgi:hypothetical protein